MKTVLKKILALCGIIVSRETRHPVHLTRRFFIGVGILVVLIFVGMIGMYEYSTHPDFCNSCHIMEPYYNAWKTSKHFGKAVCVDCHYPPAESLKEHLWHKFQASAQVVKYVTRTYSSKPFAEIEDAACLRSGCHSTRLLEGRVVTGKGINFDHAAHILEERRGRQLRCTSCHSQVVVGRHVEVTYDTCYLCHFKGRGEGRDLNPIGGCLGCHDLPEQSFTLGTMSYNHKDFVTTRHIDCQDCHLDVVQGMGDAPQDRCYTCHNQPEKLEKYADIPFIHENHVTKHNVACFHCHQEIQHGFQGARSSEDGGAASTLPLPGETKETTDHPRVAFDCAYCHQDKHIGQREMYTGDAMTLGLPSMPSPMFLAQVDCVGCHYEATIVPGEAAFSGKTFKASEEACIKCHGPRFVGVWEETKAELTATLEQMTSKLAAAKTALGAAPLSSAERGALEQKLSQAERWHHFVHASHGEHNIYLSSLALRRADTNLMEIGQKIGATLSDLSATPLVSGGYCATLCHSKVGVQVPPETVTIEGKTMPHKMHTEMMGCVTCHEIGAHKKVPLKKGFKEVCTGCHPS